MSIATVRNVIIILAIAAVVAIVPGGGAGANVVIQVVSLLFLGALCWIAAVQYREHRTSLYSLGDRRRGALYAAAAVLAVTLTATHRLLQSPAGSVAWVVLIGASLYVGGTMIWSARRH